MSLSESVELPCSSQIIPQLWDIYITKPSGKETYADCNTHTQDSTHFK